MANHAGDHTGSPLRAVSRERREDRGTVVAFAVRGELVEAWTALRQACPERGRRAQCERQAPFPQQSITPGAVDTPNDENADLSLRRLPSSSFCHSSEIQRRYPSCGEGYLLLATFARLRWPDGPKRSPVYISLPIQCPSRLASPMECGFLASPIL